MKFFNIDLHTSVIKDLQIIFDKLNHNIDDICMSSHAFILGKRTQTTKIVTPQNWRQLDKSMCDMFYNEYKNSLSEYDGFVCAYPPSFALLYEKFNKPIILQVPIRFEVPFQNDKKKLDYFIDFLKRGIDNKQIIPVCNSLYEKRYCEKFTKREWNLIPNICDYTGINYQGGNDFILYSITPIICNKDNVKTKEEYLGFNYSWQKLNNVKGIIHLPYNISTMSIFEQYTGNIPLLFPTPEFVIELYSKGLSLKQISWNDNKLIDLEWIKLADFYQEEWMPYITYFSSFNDLKEKVDTIDTNQISNNMKEFNIIRKQKIYDLWKNILNQYQENKL